MKHNCEALILCPSGHPDRPMSLRNFAHAVHTRYRESGRMEDLEEGITYNRKELSLLPPDHPARSQSLYNLALVVHVRNEQSGKLEDFEESFILYEQ